MTLRALKSSFFVCILILITVSGILRADNSTKATYGFYTETYAGLNYDSTVATDTDKGFLMEWGWPNSLPVFTDDLYYTEGSLGLGCYTTGFPNSYGGYEIAFGSNYTVNDKDMSRYTGGSIEFDIKCSMDYPFYTPPSAIQCQLQWAATYLGDGSGVKSDVITLNSYGIASNGNWQHCSIPFTAFYNKSEDWSFVGDSQGVDGIKHFDGMIFSVGISSAMFIVDNFVWKSLSTGSMSATLTNRFSGVAASSFTWSGAVPGTTKWKTADQYIKLQTDYYDSPGGSTWGIQIYTDNKNTTANPKYTGKGNPVGLVNVSTTVAALPMCWRMVDVSTTSLTVVQGTDTHLYSQELGGQAVGFPCYLWMEDKNTAGFANANDYVMVRDIRGIHYAEADWGGASPITYLYIAADFTHATTPNSYITNKLILELFHE